MTTLEQIALTAEVMWKTAVNFWPVVAFAIAVQIGIWVQAGRENRARLRKMRK